MVSLIVAYDRARGIGKGNRLPWRLPAEMQHFKKTTMAKPIVMGRRTFESIGRPLPGRRNIVVTRGMAPIEGVAQVASIEEAFRLDRDAAEIMVIGGSALYAAALDHARRVIATEVDGLFECDAFFPGLNPREWQETSRTRRPPDPLNPFALDFVVFERRAPDP